MKFLQALFCFLFSASVIAQDTFSIVAADSATREVGSAGASCVDLFAAGISDAGFLGDLFSDTGAINTQASYTSVNQANARDRMRAGDTPSQIISWLSTNDAGGNATIRQYGIVGFSGGISAAAYTGTGCIDYKNHITGSIDGIHYSIQGNILSGQNILDSMESKFRHAQGNLACRLMSALQGANKAGADTRCASDGTSSLFAFLKVAQPTDPYGQPGLSVSVRTHDNSQIEPVDSLQVLFNALPNCPSVGISKQGRGARISIYPNPSAGSVYFSIQPEKHYLLQVWTITGMLLHSKYAGEPPYRIELPHPGPGVYLYSVISEGEIFGSGKFILE